MKRKREIRWSASAGAQQWNRSLPGELSLFLLCMLLFFGAACGMLQSVFEWEIVTAGILLRVAVVTLLVSLSVEATWLLKPFAGKLVRGSIGVGGLFGFFAYLWKTEAGQATLDGLYAVANVYLNRWNAYFNTSLRCATGDFDEILTALEFGLTFLCFVFVWWARVSKRAWLPVLVPGIVLLAELLVGLAPEGLSLLAAAVGVFSVNATGYGRPEFAAAPDKYGTARGNGRGRYFFWIFVCAGVFLLCAGVRTVGMGSAASTVENGKNKLEQKNKEILQDITDWTGWQEVNVAKSVEKAIEEFLHKKEIETKSRPESNFARLDNSTPEYEEVAVLRIAMDKKPKYGAYLIGFYAGNYDDGVWDTDVEAFEKACKKAGFDPETVSKEILSLAPNRVAAYYGKENLSDFSWRGIGGTIQYAKANLIKTFLPYFVEVTDVKIRTEGDARYVKEKGTTKAEFTLWNYDVDGIIAIVFREENTDKPRTKEAWELWYEEYVKDHYLTVPKGMKQVEKVAEEVRNSEKNFFSIEGRNSLNFDRLNKAYQVAEWMRKNTSYSLELPELPKGSDPVEYFLGTSRQGYCMHYASASVMILRELGVPARYVSGYVAGNYWQDGTTMKFEAVVKDSAAHAWVEIYLEGFGWIPIEVTAGYSVSPTREIVYEQTETGNYQVVQKEWISGSNPGFGDVVPFITPKPTATPAPTATPSPEESDTDSKKDEEDSSISQVGGAEGPGAPGDEKTSDENQEDKQSEGNEKDTKADGMALKRTGKFLVSLLGCTAAICLLFVLLSACGVFRKIGCVAEERRLLKRKSFAGNRQRIKIWNRMLYRKLYAKGSLRKKHVWDEEYEAVLKKSCEMLLPEELERYMYLVKAAAFSKHEFTEEEAAFCKQVYHRILYASKKVESKPENANR